MLSLSLSSVLNSLLISFSDHFTYVINNLGETRIFYIADKTGLTWTKMTLNYPVTSPSFKTGNYLPLESKLLYLCHPEYND